MGIIQWLQDHWNALVYVLVTIRDHIQDALDTYYDRLRQLYRELYLSIWYLAYYYFNRTLNFVRDWYDKLSQFALWWWDRFIHIVQDLYSQFIDLAYYYYNRLIQVVRDWYQQLANFNGWWYSRIQTLVQDWWDKLANFNGWWYLRIQTLVQDWWDKLARFNGLWYPKVQTLLDDLWDKLYQVLVTWYLNLDHLFHNLYVGLDELVKHYYGPITSFFQNPAQIVLGIIEAWLWSFGEYLLALLLLSPNQEKPPRPVVGGSDAPPGGEGTGRPIWPTPGHTISGYGFSQQHPGIDIGLSMGTPVVATTDGLVVAVAYSNEGYGNRVDLQGDQGYWSRYGHLQTIMVSSGQRVGQGQLLALGDSTGNSTGPHLHFELKYNGSYIDPLSVLP